MSRYTGNKVVVNPSMESQTVDPNTDGNSDPTKTTIDPVVEDNFEIPGEDIVDAEAAKESDYVCDELVKEQTRAVDNIAAEGAKATTVIDALVAVSGEMHAVLAANGKFTDGEAFVLQNLVASVEQYMPELAMASAMPSMEDYRTPGLAYSNANVSMEGIGDSINAALMKLQASIEQSIKDTIGGFKEFSPRIQDQIVRAREIGARLNSANRDAGEKEVSGKFVKRLSVDGRAPDATTLLKTAKYLDQCIREVTGPELSTTAAHQIDQLQKAIAGGFENGEIKSPSILLRLFLVGLAMGMGALVGSAVGLGAVAGSMNAHLVNGATQAAINAGKFGLAAGAAGGATINSTTAALIHANGLNTKVQKQVKMDKSLVPSTFEMFPSVAKVNGGDDVPKFMQGKHSLPLLGNRVIQVTQYDKEVEPSLAVKAIPKLTLEKVGGGVGKSMQSLNGGQQKEALSLAESLLNQAAAYFSNYRTRNQHVYDTQIKSIELIAKTQKQFNGVTERAIVNSVNQTLTWYTRMYHKGLFGEQAKIAMYAFESARALIDLVEASSSAANTNATPSAESFNPFLD